MMFNGFSELSIMISRLPVFYKQRDNYFHPAWAWSVASWILRVPYSVLEAVVWSCVVYYTVGFAPEAGRYFLFFWVMFMLSVFCLCLPFHYFQIFPSHVLAVLFTSNGIGALPDDGVHCSRYGHCQHIRISFSVNRILDGWIYHP